MLSKFPAYSIHLKSRTDRLPAILELEAALGIRITIFDASDGTELWYSPSVPKKHPWHLDSITKGMVGATDSHLKLLETVNRTDARGVLVFEDDAEALRDVSTIKDYLEQVKRFTDEGASINTDREWHILLLGANDYVSSQPLTHTIKRIHRFWGAHAMYIKKDTFVYIYNTFRKYKKEGIFLPADWLYNKAIEDYRLIVYGPSDPKQFIQQKVGVISSITGKIRM
jgi:GR25 family glycosyltransferase involved in LPS biosynthesis